MTEEEAKQAIKNLEEKIRSTQQMFCVGEFERQKPLLLVVLKILDLLFKDEGPDYIFWSNCPRLNHSTKTRYTDREILTNADIKRTPEFNAILSIFPFDKIVQFNNEFVVKCIKTRLNEWEIHTSFDTDLY